MRVRHAVSLVAACIFAALVPSLASAAACPPLDCGPAGMSVAGGRAVAVTSKGTSVVVDLATGRVRATLVGAVFAADGTRAVVQEGTQLRTVALPTGKVVGRAPAGDFQLAGVSADARRIVLLRKRGVATDVAVRRGASTRRLTLQGDFDFDGVLGNRLYLIERVGPSGYYVRVADLSTGKLAPQPLKDADEPALIAGQPWSRLPSHDGRYLFTVYVTPQGEAMVHELDLRNGKAWCIDLPGSGDYNAAASYATALSRDGSRLYAAGAAYGKVVTIDVASHQVVATASFAPVRPSQPSMPSASVSPDGKTLAFGNVGTAWRFDLDAGRVVGTVRLPAAPSLVAYAPSGRIWAVDRGGAAKRVA